MRVESRNPRAVSRSLALVVAAGLLGPMAAAAQHHNEGTSGETKTYLVKGLRIDPENPPPGSGVGRAGARLPGGGYLHVVYGKPYARGRQIFGGLVGYGQIWATGAHQATELVTTVPVMVAGEHLEPGVYSLFTTPGPDRWTLHLNSDLGMHLADEYDPANDVLVVDAVPRTLDEPTPELILEFLPAEGGADLRIRWDRTAVTFPIRGH